MDKKKCTHCDTENPLNFRYCSSCGYELPKINPEDLEKSIPVPVKTKSPVGKRLLAFSIGVVAFVLAYFAVQQVFFQTSMFDKKMMEVAGEINKSCPIMIDAETRLDNAIALPKNVFQYNYTLVNMELAKSDTVQMKKVLEPNITNFVKTNPQMQAQRDLKTTINYYYKDKAGKFMFLISVTPDKYE